MEHLTVNTTETNPESDPERDLKIFLHIFEKQQALLDRKLPMVRAAMPKYARQIVEDLIATGKIRKNGKTYEW